MGAAGRWMSWTKRPACAFGVWSDSQKIREQPVFQFRVDHLSPDLLPAALRQKESGASGFYCGAYFACDNVPYNTL